MAKHARRFLWFASVLIPMSLLAQANPQAAQVRALNNEVIRLYASLGRATPNEQALLRAQAAPIMAQREVALAALIQEDAAEALRLAFPADLVAALSAAFPQSAARLEQRGRWEGPVEYIVMDGLNFSSHRSVRRILSGGEKLEVHFAGPEPAGLKCNDRLAVTGVRAGQRIAVEQASIIASAAATAACSTLGEQKIAVILVNFPVAKLPGAVTPELLRGIMLGNAYGSYNSIDWSVDDFWVQNSDGKTWIAKSGASALTVVGPYTLSQDYAYCNGSGDQSDALRKAAYAAADGDLNFANYSRVAIVVPAIGGCPYAGVGTLGCWSGECPGDGMCNYSWTWWRADQIQNRANGVRLATHEIGHNLTLHHASSRDFGSEALGPVGAAGTLTEYGDYFGTMGSWNFGPYSSQHAVQQLGWFSGTNYQVVTTSGAYTIEGFDKRPFGLKALKIARGSGSTSNWLWLAYYPNSGIYLSQLKPQVHSGALIHYQDATTGTHTHLLDFTPGSSSTADWDDPALAVGQTWQDPYTNLSITVNSIVNGNLNVTVTYGVAPCTYANPSVTISPTSATTAPNTPYSFTVTVKNNDSSSCQARTFNLSSTLPSGWSTTFAPASLSLAPGASASSTETTVPPAGALGQYDVNAIAAAGSNSGEGRATLNVVEKPVVTLDDLNAAYPVRSTVPITARVASGGQPAAGASVKFTLTKSGSTKATTKTVTAGADGVAVWSYKASSAGTYSVYAVATYNGQTSERSNTETFTLSK